MLVTVVFPVVVLSPFASDYQDLLFIYRDDSRTASGHLEPL